MLPRTALAVIAAQSHLLAERTLADGVAAAGAARGAVAEAMPPLELSSWPDASRRRHPVPLLVDCRVTTVCRCRSTARRERWCAAPLVAGASRRRHTLPLLVGPSCRQLRVSADNARIHCSVRSAARGSCAPRCRRRWSQCWAVIAAAAAWEGNHARTARRVPQHKLGWIVAATTSSAADSPQ